MISKKLAIEVLNASLATGADYAEIFFEDSCAKGISLENGKVDNATSTTSTGVGLRLLKENTEYPEIEVLYSSPMLRCRQTASVLYPEKEIISVENLSLVEDIFNGEVYKAYKVVWSVINWI